MPETTPPSDEATKEIKIRLNKGKQEEFCSLPDSVFEGFYGGAAGGGKSYCLLVLPLLRKFYEIPTFHGLILRRTFPELVAHQIEEAHKWYPLFGAKYNEQKKRYKFPSGAIIDFGHAEYESDVKKYDSAEYQLIEPDELTSFTEFQYRYLLSRCTTSDKRLPSIIRSASNPGNIGHSFVRDRFVKPAPTGGKIIRDKVTGLTRIFIQAFASDNPILLDASPHYLKQLELLPEAEKRAKLYGDWWSFSGQVFEEFRIEPYVDEPKEACHVIDDGYEIPSYCPRVLAIDWGFAANTVGFWGAVLPNKRLIVEDEYCVNRRTVEQWSTDIAQKSTNNYPSLITMDPSAWQNRGGEMTIAEQFTNVWIRIFGKQPNLIKADNDRIGGKMLIHDYLRWKPLPTLQIGSDKYNADIADTILRLHGLDAHRKYLDQFVPKDIKDEVPLPRLLVKRHCSELIKTIPLCVYAANSKDGKSAEDVAEFVGDDAYDTLRYLVKGAEYYYDASAKGEIKAQHSQSRIEIVQELNSQQDMTKFYRRMEALEAQMGKRVPSIKFQRRRRG